MSNEVVYNERNFLEITYPLLQKPPVRSFLGRTNVSWCFLEESGDSIFQFFDSKDATFDQINALVSNQHGIFSASSTQSGQIYLHEPLTRGPMYARINERFLLAEKLERYKHPAVDSAWLLLYSLGDSDVLLTTHQTCDELETNWVDVFSQRSIDQHTTFKNDPLIWKHPWIPKGSKITSSYRTLIKNPHILGDSTERFGARNGIIPIEIDYSDVVMFACSINRGGQIIPARPIESYYQEKLYNMYLQANREN